MLWYLSSVFSWQCIIPQVKSWMAVSASTKQRYYAQCGQCSSRQGGLIAAASRRASMLVMHRWWRLTPGAIPRIIVGLRQMHFTEVLGRSQPGKLKKQDTRAGIKVPYALIGWELQ